MTTRQAKSNGAAARDHAFSPQCPQCRPVLFDAAGQELPADSPILRAVVEAWEDAPLAEQLALHVLMRDGRIKPEKQPLIRSLQERVQAALRATGSDITITIEP